MAQPSHLKGVYMLKRKKGGFGRINIVPKDIYAYNVGIIGESGIGKEQPLDAEIITPDGIKTMGDMKVGSKVIGQDGKAYNVVGVYPQGVKPVYKISFSDGSFTECGLEHLWKIFKLKNGSFDNGSVVTLKSMINDIENVKNEHYFIETPNAVTFNSGLHDNDVIYSDLKTRREYLEKIINEFGEKNPTNDIVISLEKINEIQNLKFITKSLGFLFCIKGDKVVLKGDFKKLNLNNDFSGVMERLNQKISITNIEYTSDKECQCIMIDNPEHLYLTNDFIVTHNTTLMKEVCEKTAGRDGYMLLDIGREDGTKAISGVVTEKVTTFAKQFDEIGEKIDKYKDLDGVGLLDIVEDIIENKDEFYPNLKVLVFDTLDELIGITEPYIVEKDNLRLRSEGKPANVKTINEAYGGFMRGQDEVIEEIMRVKDNLNSVGVSFWFVGHTKMRTKSDPFSGAEYDLFTTNLSHRYFNAFKDKLHFLGVIVMDRNIDKTIEKQFGHTKTKGTLVGEKRIINFRDDNYAIDSKSRFQEIEDNIEYGSDNFINALETAIEKERAKDIGVDTAKIEKERAKEDIKIAEIRKETAKKKLIGVVEKSTDELLSEIKEMLNSVSDSTKKMDIVNAIPKELEKLGAKDLMSASSEQLNSILNFVTQLAK